MYEESAQDELLSGSPDYVLDCIDNIDTKVLALHLLLEGLLISVINTHRFTD